MTFDPEEAKGSIANQRIEVEDYGVANPSSGARWTAVTVTFDARKTIGKTEVENQCMMVSL